MGATKDRAAYVLKCLSHCRHTVDLLTELCYRPMYTDVFSLRVHVTFLRGHSTRKERKCKATVEHYVCTQSDQLTVKAHTLF